MLTAMLALTVLAPTCGEDDSAPRVWCDAFCTAEHRCLSGSSSSCSDECVRSRRGLRYLSTDGAQALAPCLAKLSCQVFANDDAWVAETDACWQAATDSVQVRPALRAFCLDYGQAGFECGYSSSTDSCERHMAMWADSIVDRLRPCAAEPTCAAIESCTQMVWDAL